MVEFLKMLRLDVNAENMISSEVVIRSNNTEISRAVIEYIRLDEILKIQFCPANNRDLYENEKQHIYEFVALTFKNGSKNVYKGDPILRDWLEKHTKSS